MSRGLSRPGDPSLSALVRRVKGLQDKLRGKVELRTATVTGISGDVMQVTIDGDSSPLAARPRTIIAASTLNVGDRVLVSWTRGTVTVLGKLGGEPIVNNDTAWAPLTLRSGFTVHDDNAPRWRIYRDRFQMRGAVTTSGGFSGSYSDVLNLPAAADPYIDEWDSARLFLSGAGQTPGRGYFEGRVLRLASVGESSPYLGLNNEWYIV